MTLVRALGMTFKFGVSYFRVRYLYLARYLHVFGMIHRGRVMKIDMYKQIPMYIFYLPY